MMKTRKYIAVIFAAMVMGISGCNDDLFLEEHPDTFYTAEDAFKTVDQVMPTLVIGYRMTCF